jgi:hypothetical protein
MKAIIAAIAAIGAMSASVGSAFADVSISINFGSRPAYSSPNYYKTYRTNTYRTNVYRYPSVVHSPTYNNYNSGFNSGITNFGSINFGSRLRGVYPSRSIYSTNLSNRHYNSYRSDQYGDRYIIEKRIIRVR